MDRCDFCDNLEREYARNHPDLRELRYGCTPEQCNRALMLFMRYVEMTTSPKPNKEVNVTKNYHNNRS